MLTLFFTVPVGAEPIETPPRDAVIALYHDYAWEIILSHSNYVELIDQTKPELEKYFTRELTAFLLKDSACRARTKDICRLDFDPIFGSQDRSIVYDFEVSEAAPVGQVIVQFRAAVGAQLTRMKFILKRTEKGWRIDDIDYGPGRSSLRAVLSHQ